MVIKATVGGGRGGLFWCARTNVSYLISDTNKYRDRHRQCLYRWRNWWTKFHFNNFLTSNKIQSNKIQLSYVFVFQYSVFTNHSKGYWFRLNSICFNTKRCLQKQISIINWIRTQNVIVNGTRITTLCFEDKSSIYYSK